MYAVSEYPHPFRFSLSVNPPIQSVHSADGSLAAFPSQELIAVPEKREIRTVLTRTYHDSKLRFYVTKTDTLKEFHTSSPLETSPKRLPVRFRLFMHQGLQDKVKLSRHQCRNIVRTGHVKKRSRKTLKAAKAGREKTVASTAVFSSKNLSW